MNVEALCDRLTRLGFVLGPKRGRKNEFGYRCHRFTHPDVRGRGALYAAPDYLSATGATTFRLLERAVAPTDHGYNGYPHWRGRALEEVLLVLTQRHGRSGATAGPATGGEEPGASERAPTAAAGKGDAPPILGRAQTSGRGRRPSRRRDDHRADRTDDRLDDRLLAAFADAFFGYGDYAAPYWFIGMEEGGGDSVAAVRRRLAAWDERGRREVDDLPTYARLAGVGHWFGATPKLQPTWSKLIRVVLSAEGRSPSSEDVRRFQRDELGRPGGSTALLELLPLPSPSTNHWLYGDHSALSHLADRETYHAHYAPRRAEHIGRRVREHRPRAVVFYGKGYLPWWERVVDGSFEEAGPPDLLRAERDGTTFLVTPHPVAWGVTNAFFERVGREAAGA